MKAKRVLTRRKEFAQLLNRGNLKVGSRLIMRTRANGLEMSRFGLVTSKRVGNAVVRNRVRRRLREVLRQLNLMPGWDIVFVARRAAATAKYADIEKEVRELLARARLLSENNEKNRLSPN